MQSDGLIYVLTDGIGHFRVGISSPTSIDESVKTLQRGNPFALRIVHQRTFPQSIGASVKEMVHTALKPRRVRGEWFRDKKETITAAVDAAVDRLHRPQEDVVEVLDAFYTAVRTPIQAGE